MQNYFKYLNNYFDKIVVLTLPRLTDRIEYINKTFEGLNFEFFYGVDKETTSLQELKDKGLYDTAAYQRFYKKPLEISTGMLCCSLGHRNIYEYILEKGFEKTLILEDDAVPVAEQLANFPSIIQELPGDWELFYLGYEKNEGSGIKEKISSFVRSRFPHHTQLKLNRQIFLNYYPTPLSSLIAKAGFHDCTHAYAITKEAAGKLLGQSKPVRFHPDNLLSYMNCTQQLKGYISRKKLFTQLTAFVNKMESLTSS